MSGKEDPAPAFNPQRKIVIVRGLRNGNVEFEFAVGDTAMSVELMMPEAAFEEFCRTNNVLKVDADPHPAPTSDAQRAMEWRPSDVQRHI